MWNMFVMKYLPSGMKCLVHQQRLQIGEMQVRDISDLIYMSTLVVEAAAVGVEATVCLLFAQLALY